MKKNTLLLLGMFAIGSLQMHAQVPEQAPSDVQDHPAAFNPTIKIHALMHARFESSLTDSVDVQGQFSDDPVSNSFRLRRLELRTDLKLNAHWSGVIRIQFLDLKTPTPGKAMELAYFQYSYNDKLNIRGGQMKTPYELEEFTGNDDLRMIDRGTTDIILASNSLTSYQPGLMVFGTFIKNKTPLTYYVGAFNGSNRGLVYDVNSQKNAVARIEFSPIKTLMLSVSDQLVFVSKDAHGNSFGSDLSLQQPLGKRSLLIVEGEYIMGPNVNLFTTAADSSKTLCDYNMNGYFGQALLRINTGLNWCRTLELGGKYEYTDPWSHESAASGGSAATSFTTISGEVGFIFLPDNTARLQLNLINTTYEEEFAGLLKNNLMFMMQMQLKI